MSRKLLLGGLGIATVAVIIVIVLLLLKAIPLLTESTGEINVDGMEPEVVGLDDLNLMNFLPIVQLFIGEAVKVENPDVNVEPASVSTPQFSMMLPAGWSKTRESSTENTYSLFLENADGDFATVMSVSGATDADRYIQDFVARYGSTVERTGLSITTYKAVSDKGYAVQALDADSPNLAVRVRAWFDTQSQSVYIVVLNSVPENLSTSEAILRGPSQA